MKLYDYWRSSAAYRVRIALNLKRLEAERDYIHLRRKDQLSPAYRALNPMGLVPTLVDDDGTVVTQSLAICAYLDETRTETTLLPADAAGRARVRAIALAIACDIHPLNNLRVLRHLGSALGIDEPTRNERWYRHWIAEGGFIGIEAMLAGNPATGRFCHGDVPTLADVCLVPQVANAERLDCDMRDYPTVMRIHETCCAETTFGAARPEAQPDAE